MKRIVAFLRRLLRREELVEETPDPITTRPICPYREGWPLAGHWYRGVEDALHGRYPSGDAARLEGQEAGLAYMRSGQALKDLRGGKLTIGW